MYTINIAIRKCWHSNLIIIVALLFVQCKNPKNIVSNKTDFTVFSMETTSCRGTCPVYRFVIKDSGAATYEGKEHVERLGIYQSTLSSSQIDALNVQLSQIKFYDMILKNDMKINDLPSTHLYSKNDTSEKKIFYYYPKNENLEKIISYVNELIGKTDWAISKD